jgi:hypothetical protein
MDTVTALALNYIEVFNIYIAMGSEKDPTHYSNRCVDTGGCFNLTGNRSKGVSRHMIRTSYVHPSVNTRNQQTKGHVNLCLLACS